ncbi:MAG: hypothetical protein NTY17_03900 [Planctomycetia bacterium]|nr:hypothetical protein [Planctomycetia bacterium]
MRDQNKVLARGEYYHPPSLPKIFQCDARIVKLMEEQGLTDPSIRPTDRTDKVSRWCSRHWLKAGERTSGGRRRKGA